jgi:SAM-dependent methyltransferase
LCLFFGLHSKDNQVHEIRYNRAADAVDCSFQRAGNSTEISTPMTGRSIPGEVGLATGGRARDDGELLRLNRRFYDPLWSDTRLIRPQRFSTWPLVRSLLSQAARRLEVAPGLRPRLPLGGTEFIDISMPALNKLRSQGGGVAVGSVCRLPFASCSFDLVCALDIVEHVDDDDSAVSELARVCAVNGVLMLSAPLHPSRWTAFDEFVGHRRRYEPDSLFEKLAKHGLEIWKSAVFGMRPRSSWVTGIGMWWLSHQRERAMWWYNRVIMPVALRFNKELVLHDGIVDPSEVDELLLVCRKTVARGS